MRVYFLSYIPAALKLNGLYLGGIDGFERHVKLDPEQRVLAEIIPADNLQPLNFFLDEGFFKNPPDFADVYLTDGDAVVYIRNYDNKQAALSLIYQTRFCGNLITVFRQGGIFLSAEGAEYSLTPLSESFAKVEAQEKTIAGRSVLALYGGGLLAIISESGKLIFLNPAESAEFGDNLTVVCPFETCNAAKAECTFFYDGEKLNLVSSKTVETQTPEKEVLHFAFFESVLCRGDYKKYINGELLPKADAIPEFLGNFVGVTIPTEKFYALHGNIPAAGLVYPKSKNLYEVKYFRVDFEDDKISNIYPVE